MVRGALPIAVSAVLHVAVPAALIATALRWGSPGAVCPSDHLRLPSSSFDPRVILLGSTDAEVRRILNDRSDPEERKGASCVHYQYDSGSVSTLFFRHDLVEGVGLGPDNLPDACLGRAVTAITLPAAG